MIEIKDRIIELRLSKGLTQNELAKELNLSPSSIGMYEQGRRKPSFELLEKISDYFNVDMDYLMGRSEIKNKYQLEKKKEGFPNSIPEVEFMSIPLYASVSAGYGSCQSEFIKMIAIPGLKPNGTTYFAVKVKGDSMEPKIPDNSTVIIKKDVVIENGDIGAFYYNGESYVKQKRINNGKLILHSFNLAYESILVQPYDDFKEYGKVVKVLIDL